MANTIKLKKSSVAAKVPLASDLDYGELAINYSDGNLFFKDSSNNIQTIASTQSVSVTGNVTGNYFIGNGSTLTGINAFGTVAVAGETSVAANTTSGTLTLTAGSGIEITTDSGNNAITLTASDTDTVYTSMLYGTGGMMGSLNHPVTSQSDAGLVTANVDQRQDLGLVTQPNTVHYAASDVGTLSLLSVIGNVVTGNILTDGYFYANGEPFAGGGGGDYGNANVATFLAAFGSNTITTTGNVTVGNILTDGYFYANGEPFAGGGGGDYGNANVAAYLPTYTGNFSADAVTATGNITSSGNISANYFLGNGRFLSGVQSSGLGNGNSEITVPELDGNVTVQVDGYADSLVIGVNFLSIGGAFATPKTIDTAVRVANAVNSILISPVTLGDLGTISIPDDATLTVWTPT